MTPTSRVEQHGFTLLELLVVLAIIALGLGLLAPNIGLTDNAGFNAEVRRAAATLTYARRMAIVQGAPVTAQLRVGTAATPDALAEAGVAPDAEVATEQRQRLWSSEGLQLQYQDDLRGSPVPVELLPVTFYPQGGSTGGTLYFSRAARSASISINPVTGRIRIGWDAAET